MLFRALGTGDAVGVLILLGAAILPSKLLFWAAMYFMIKGLFFIWLSRDIASYGDFIAGSYMWILSLGISIPYLHQVVIFYLLQKTILTFIAIAFHAMVFYYDNKEDFPSFLR
ncbi:MAG: hypothetical protein HGA85_01910 [Nanoarchaeota archaeon]|nr:hypothetical protein [Nanoarchaeota archaeon]